VIRLEPEACPPRPGSINGGKGICRLESAADAVSAHCGVTRDQSQRVLYQHKLPRRRLIRPYPNTGIATVPSAAICNGSSQALRSLGTGLHDFHFKEASVGRRACGDMQSVQNRSQSTPACSKSLHAKWVRSHSIEGRATRFDLPSARLLE
jgi:hypothetical protein